MDHRAQQELSAPAMRQQNGGTRRFCRRTKSLAMELRVAGTLGWIFYAVLCLVVWPAILLVMYRVAITVLGAHLRGENSVIHSARELGQRRWAR
jgi:hypothetical protein